MAQSPGGVALAFSTIPAISTLPEPLRGEVREAFADSMIVIWQVMIGISGIGLLSSVAMKAFPLHTQTDENWGIQDSPKSLEDSQEV